MKAYADISRSTGMTVVVRWKIGHRPWQTRPIEDRFLRHFLLHRTEPLPPNRSRFLTMGALAATVRRGELTPIPVNRAGYWSEPEFMALDDATTLRVSFDYPLPAKGEPRPCAGPWNARTLTPTGCENVAIGRFSRVDADLKRRKVWLCAECGRSR